MVETMDNCPDLVNLRQVILSQGMMFQRSGRMPKSLVKESMEKTGLQIAPRLFKAVTERLQGELFGLLMIP